MKTRLYKCFVRGWKQCSKNSLYHLTLITPMQMQYTNWAWLYDPDILNDLYFFGHEVEYQNAFIPPKLRKERERNQYTIEDRYNSVFYKTYLLPSLAQDSTIRDISDRLGAKFRKRFRVPFTVFEEICTDLRNVHKLLEHRYDAKGEESIRISLLVLGSLRCIASGCTFDAIEELTCVSQDTHRVFFHKYFCTWGRDAAKDLIKMPHDDDTIAHVTAQYEKRGLPGCVGSVDCVHVCWDRCPASMHSVCKGKDNVPTLAFQVVCSHTKKIMHVSDYFWGTYNDKTIARLDPLFDLFRDDDSKLKNMTWTSNKVCQHGRKVHHGAYLICDGGYHEWACLVSPYKHQLPGSALEKWSKTVESVRKDVECVFGILKKRFLFLKHPIRLHDPEQIKRAFLTCCVLHNFLIDYDLYDEEDVEYGILEHSAELRAANSINGVGVADVRSVRRQVYLHVENDAPQDIGLVADESPLFHQRRADLIDHLSASTAIYNND